MEPLEIQLITITQFHTEKLRIGYSSALDVKTV